MPSSGAADGSASKPLTADAAPLWILRHHSPSPIHTLRLVRLERRQQDATGRRQQTFVLAGDAEGRISLTALKDLRPRFFWKAHEQSILGLDIIQLDSDDHLTIISQARDNKVHLFRLRDVDALTLHDVLPSRMQHDLPTPECISSLDINALNYCAMSLLSLPDDEKAGMLLAIPHTLDSGYVDVHHLPSYDRVARAVGQADIQSGKARTQRAPMCMSIHLLPPVSAESRFRLLAGYEDGYMRMWSMDNGAGTTLEWSSREHTESLMASCVSPQAQSAYSVAADDQVVRYELGEVRSNDARSRGVTCRSMGNASLAVREDEAYIAVGGWDGVVRMYDADLQHVASLRYHKDTVQALSFAVARTLRDSSHKSYDKVEDVIGDSDDEDDDGDSNALGSIASEQLLITGGKEGRICIWRVG